MEETILDVLANDKWPVYAWYGLVGYVLISDSALNLFGHPYMTDAWYDALAHPTHRLGLIAAWIFVTKHLFFRDLVPWLDPFAIIGLAVAGIKKLIQTGSKLL